jgi:hypothetical protein
MEGVCSKACFAKQHHAIDDELGEQMKATGEMHPQIEAVGSSNLLISVICPCGNSLQVPKMYCGSFRKCPSCGEKLLVPDK